MGPLLAQSLAALIANLMTLGAGMVMGWSSPALPKLLDPDDKGDLKLTSDEASWAVSMGSFGSIFGPMIFNSFVDRVGRKRSLHLIVLPMLASWLIMGLTASVEALYVSRFLGGIGLGSIYALMPMYIGEIAEDRIRGALGILITTGLATGMLLSFSIGPWISRQMLCVASASPLLLFLILSSWIPETPYFLLMKGEKKKARASLAWLRGRTYVDEEISALQTSVVEQQKVGDGFGMAELFRSRCNRRALGIAVGLLTFQQFSGIMAILSYNSLIFESSGLTGWNEISAIIVGVVDVGACISVIFIVDSAGRRPILITTSILTSLSLVCEAVFFHLKTAGYDTSSFSWTPLLGLMVFHLSFAPGFGTIPHVMISELFATNVKAPATMLLSVHGSSVQMVVVKIYQLVDDAIGTHWIFYFFASTTLVGTLFIYVFVPETKKISLQAIQDKLSSGKVGSANAPAHAVER